MESRMQGSEHQNTLRIAVVEEQILGLREQQRAHNETTQRRFDRMEKKLDDLTAIMNRGRGAFTVSVAMAAAIVAAMIKAVAILQSIFQRGVT